jgi:hypothetical protein
MDDPILLVVREKNRRGAALHKDDYAIARRVHTSGTVPAAWLARCDELAAAYGEALQKYTRHQQDRRLALGWQLEREARALVGKLTVEG